MEIFNEVAEALFAFAEGFDGAALLGNVGDRDEDSTEFTRGSQLGNNIEDGPNHLLLRRSPVAKNLVQKRLASAKDSGERALGLGNHRAILAHWSEAEFVDLLADQLIAGNSQEIDDGPVGEHDAPIRVVGNDSDMEIVHQIAKAFFTGAQSFLSGLYFGDVANRDDGMVLAAEIRERAGKQAVTNLTGLGAELNFEVADDAFFGELGEERLAGEWIDP